MITTTLFAFLLHQTKAHISYISHLTKERKNVLLIGDTHSTSERNQIDKLNHYTMRDFSILYALQRITSHMQEKNRWIIEQGSEETKFLDPSNTQNTKTNKETAPIKTNESTKPKKYAKVEDKDMSFSLISSFSTSIKLSKGAQELTKSQSYFKNGDLSISLIDGLSNTVYEIQKVLLHNCTKLCPEKYYQEAVLKYKNTGVYNPDDVCIHNNKLLFKRWFKKDGHLDKFIEKSNKKIANATILSIKKEVACLKSYIYQLKKTTNYSSLEFKAIIKAENLLDIYINELHEYCDKYNVHDDDTLMTAVMSRVKAEKSLASLGQEEGDSRTAILKITVENLRDLNLYIHTIGSQQELNTTILFTGSAHTKSIKNLLLEDGYTSIYQVDESSLENTGMLLDKIALSASTIDDTADFYEVCENMDFDKWNPKYYVEDIDGTCFLTHLH